MKTLRLCLIIGVSLAGLPTTACVADDRTAPVAKVATATSNDASVSAASAQELSKVYMNCLIEVDRTLSVLARHAKHKAVESEAESQRAFCANRKRDCQERPQSAECRTFVEEFSQSVGVGASPR
jgi:hypothetical protein